jgi:hypothetical protein
MNRRQLFGTLAALTVTVVPLVAREKPRLYGDGIHDDTAALQAILDSGPGAVLPSGRYLLSKPLVVTQPNTVIAGSHFTYVGQYGIHVKKTSVGSVVTGNVFRPG